jgi:cyclophilin family peptidyl-prolyl cis-trans isomerase
MSTFSPESIPDVADVREDLARRVERWRVPILGGLAVAVLGTLGLVAWSSLRRERLDAVRAELHGIVDDYEGRRSLFRLAGMEPIVDREAAEEQAKRLEELRPRSEGTPVEPWRLLHLALRRQVLEQDDAAIAALRSIKTDHADSPVARLPSYDSDRTSLVDRLVSVSEKRRKFAAERKWVEPKPDASVVALVETDLGRFKIVFYRDLAPKHADAFARTAKAGGFNGTRLYQARKGEHVELGGGDRTRNDEPRDDREDDPALAIAPEDAARHYVKHRRRMVTSVPLLSGDQSDRFAIVLAETKAEFDGIRTPFGELLDDESAGVADRLGNAIVYGEDAAFVNRPQRTDYPWTPSEPVRIWRVSIWREGALDAGHAWDTARVNTETREPEPEPEK